MIHNATLLHNCSRWQVLPFGISSILSSINHCFSLQKISTWSNSLKHLKNQCHSVFYISYVKKYVKCKLSDSTEVDDRKYNCRDSCLKLGNYNLKLFSRSSLQKRIIEDSIDFDWQRVRILAITRTRVRIP